MAKLKDIANAVGVSASIVSRVLNDKDRKCASDEVTLKIWDAVRSMGYVPNKTAQELRMGKIQSENFVIASLYARSPEDDKNRFFVELSTYIEKAIIKQGCKIGKKYQINELSELLSNTSNSNRSGNFDGLVVLGRTNAEVNSLIAKFGKKAIHVALNRTAIDCDDVICDGEIAAKTAMKYLYDCGHKKIAYVGEYSDESRLVGYKSFLIKNNLYMSNNFIINAKMTEGGGFHASKEFVALENKPTAVFCANDVTAIGFANGMKAYGLNIPNDVSIISIDNTREAENFAPGLTSVKVPLKEMGSIAVKILIDRLQKGHVINLNINLPTQLVVRESVKLIK